MHIKNFTRGVMFGCALVSAFGTVSAFAQESLRSLAEERGRYIGAILNSEWFNNSLGGDASAYEQIHSGQFNAVVAENEMKFDATEPSRNSFSYGRGDKLVAYAKKNGMRVRGHALAWHSQVPGWVSSGNFSKAELLDILKNHIENVVGHYKGDVHEWDVVNEAINDDSNHGWRSQNSIWYQTIGPEFIDSAFVWAHAADPDAELCYNDYAIEWGTNSGSKAGFLLQQVDKWLANKIPITCIGTQTHIAINHEQTPNNIKNLAAELAKRGLRLNITELDIGFEKGSNQSQSDYEKQGHLYRQFMDVFLEAKNMGEFMIWGVSDKYSWLDGQQGKTNGLVWDRSFKAKPAYDSLMASLKAHAVADVTPANYGQEIVIDTTTKPGTTTFGKGTFTIVDYAVHPETRGSWSSDVEAGSPVFVSAAEGFSVPMAGCDQGECGYQHAIYTLPEDAVSAGVLNKCENLMVTMKGQGGAVSYVNIGVNEPWFSLQYGNAASADDFAAVSVPLDSVREKMATPTQLTFNSDGAGFNLLKIEAVGCPDGWNGSAGIRHVVAAGKLGVDVIGNTVAVSGLASERGVQLDLFDMQGRPVMSRRDASSIDVSGMAKGLYMVRVKSGSASYMERVVLK